MDKKAIAMISTDWHLKSTNIIPIVKLVEKKCQLALEHGLNNIICLGDIFDSRLSQRMDVLIAFFQILQICKKYGIVLTCVPGNHDKTDYLLEESFLRPFSFHPNLNLIENYDNWELGEYTAHFIPYFAENEKFQDYLNTVKLTGNDILFSHIAVTGSRNNDMTLIENDLTVKRFEKFKAVFLGHYHNYQSINDFIYHLPSIQQNNFGEDENKGYTLLYSDLSFDIIRSESKRYVSVKINVDQDDIRILDEMLNQYNPDDEHVRIVVEGTAEKIKSFGLQKLQERGFVIQTKEKSINSSISALQDIEIVQYNVDQIIKIFSKFCNQKNISYEEGMAFFQNSLNHSSLSTLNQLQ